MLILEKMQLKGEGEGWEGLGNKSWFKELLGVLQNKRL
jgi:hypothetical protein